MKQINIKKTKNKKLCEKKNKIKECEDLYNFKKLNREIKIKKTTKIKSKIFEFLK